MKKVTLIISLLFFALSFFSQSQRRLDSLRSLVEKAPNDTTCVKKMLTLSHNLMRKDPAEAKKIAENSIILAEKTKYLRGYADANNLLGMILSEEGNYAKALDCNRKAVPIQKKIKDDFGLSRSYNGLGSIFYQTYNLDSCVNYFLLATDLAEKSKDSNAILSLYSNLSVVLIAKKNYSSALEFSLKAIDLEKLRGDEVGLAETYINVGTLYMSMKQDSVALQYLDKAFTTFNKMHDTVRLMDVYLNYSVIYDNRKQYDKAMAVSLLVLNYATALKKEENMAQAYINVADSYEKMGRLTEAEKYYLLGIPLAEKMELRKLLMDAYNGLSGLYQKKNNYKAAIEYKDKYVAVKDSTDKQLYSENMLEMETKFDVERKEKEITLLNKDKLVQDIELTKRKGWISFFVVLVIAFIALSLLIFRSNLNRKKANKLLVSLNEDLNTSKNEIELQKHIVEEKQKEIIDSINYAKRIQTTILAHKDFMDENIPNNFVYFNPKDIVSGDFYWATKHNNKFYLAVCDSTGHGVPGAFMSLLNIGFLSEAINEKNIEKPNEVLNYVRDRLVHSISKEGQQDGFDGILMCLDHATKKITYAAAHNAPILISKRSSPTDQILELKKDKMPVGKGEREEEFVLHTVDLLPDDTLYLYTDGYADQFGGLKGKKFKYKTLNELLKEISVLPLSEQAEVLGKNFHEWKGRLEQVDDVLIIGIKI